MEQSISPIQRHDMLNATEPPNSRHPARREIDGRLPIRAMGDAQRQALSVHRRSQGKTYCIFRQDEHLGIRDSALGSSSRRPHLGFGEGRGILRSGHVWFGSGYVSAVERVLSGDAEAAAVSYYVLDKDKHLTVEQRQKLRRLAEQGPCPHMSSRFVPESPMRTGRLCAKHCLRWTMRIQNSAIAYLPPSL